MLCQANLLYIVEKTFTKLINNYESTLDRNKCDVVRVEN